MRLLIVSTVFCLFGGNIFSQVEDPVGFVIEAGPSISDLSGGNYGGRFKPRLKYQFGLFTELGIKSKVGMRAGVSFQSIGTKTKGYNIKYNCNYICIEASGKLTLRKMPGFLNLGVFHSFLVKAHSKTVHEEKQNYTSGVNPNNSGIVFGLSHYIPLNARSLLSLELKNYFGLRNTRAFTSGKAYTNALVLAFAYHIRA